MILKRHLLLDFEKLNNDSQFIRYDISSFRELFNQIKDYTLFGSLICPEDPLTDSMRPWPGTGRRFVGIHSGRQPEDGKTPSHKISCLELQENKVFGDVEILSTDQGDKLKLIYHYFKHINLQLNYTGVTLLMPPVEGVIYFHRLITWDAITMPLGELRNKKLECLIKTK